MHHNFLATTYTGLGAFAPTPTSASTPTPANQQYDNYSTQLDQGATDCCILFCSCGDDLVGGVDTRCLEENIQQDLSRHKQHHKHNSGTIAALHMERDQQTSSNNDIYDARTKTIFHNYGFVRSGCFADSDIVAVHPAVREDPTKIGFTSTSAFRNSKDQFNEHLSFSVIYLSLSGLVSTLDVECSDEAIFSLLISGFIVLKQRLQTIADAKDSNTVPLAETLRKYRDQITAENMSTQAVEIWRKSQSLLLSLDGPAATDPLAELFHTTQLMPSNHRATAGACNIDVAPRGTNVGDDHDTTPDLQQLQIPSEQFLGWKTAGTQIWARLK